MALAYTSIIMSIYDNYIMHIVRYHLRSMSGGGICSGAESAGLTTSTNPAYKLRKLSSIKKVEGHGHDCGTSTLSVKYPLRSMPGDMHCGAESAGVHVITSANAAYELRKFASTEREEGHNCTCGGKRHLPLMSIEFCKVFFETTRQIFFTN